MRRLGLLLSILTSGCSLLFVHGAPAQHETLSDFDCVSNHAGPAADIAGTVIDGVLAVTIATIEEDPDASFDDDINPVVPIAFGTLAAVHLGSAIYGFANVKSCENAKKALALRRDTTSKAQAERIKQLEAQITAGCGSDKDCKGDRICIDASCVSPPSPASASEPALTAPAPETPAPAPAAP